MTCLLILDPGVFAEVIIGSKYLFYSDFYMWFSCRVALLSTLEAFKISGWLLLSPFQVLRGDCRG